jgi:hypothetical protein
VNARAPVPQAAPTHWGAEALWLQLEPLLPGLTIEVLPTAPSTNTLLLDRARGAGDVQPCLLVAKKRYVGFSYERPDQATPSYDAKGIETQRRDSCGFVTKSMERALRILPRVIVIDDGSGDGTAAELAGVPVTLLRNARNLGKGASLWKGFERALALKPDLVEALNNLGNALAHLGRPRDAVSGGDQQQGAAGAARCDHGRDRA